MSANDLWIIAIASLVGVSCSFVGVFLVLRRLSMLGDAISHSVLFGIAAAFLLTSSRSTLAMLAGAGAVGLLTAYLTTVLTRHGKLQEDASIGVTFTWLFALGVILISAFAGSIDLDQECVLYGEIAFAPFDRFTFAGADIGPRAFWILLGVTIADLALVVTGIRRLTIAAFDEALAASLGISVVLWHYVLMSFVSITTVAAFESVGAILVVAMLVVPANAAYLVSRDVREMLLWATAISIFSAVSGYLFAAAYDGSIAASVALMTGVCFLAALTFDRWRERSRARAGAQAETAPGAAA